MSFLRTVLGDVAPESLGVCYAHEHLIIDPSYATSVTPDFLLDDVDRAASELKACYDVGVRAMVDSMPTACGRNVTKLAEVSRRSRVHVLCPTGLHLQKYYPPGHWSETIDEAKLAELFVREINEGIDAHDGAGPTFKALPHKAGLIKVAGGKDRLSAHEEKAFHAAAAAHRTTGAPILTHTEKGTAALEQLRLLRDHGVNLRHVVLSHLDRNNDVAYHRTVLQSGVRIEYDSAFRWKGELNPTFDLLIELLPEFPDQIVLGMDAARRSYWSTYGGKPGMAFLYTTWVARLREAGISDDLLHKVFVTTPADAYSFVGRES